MVVLCPRNIPTCYPILFQSHVSPAEILSSGITLHIHLTILASFLSSLITVSSSTGQVSLLFDCTLTSSNCATMIALCHQETKLLHNFKRMTIAFYAWTISNVCLLIYTCLAFNFAILFQFTNDMAGSLGTQHLQNWQRLELLPLPFLHTEPENLSSFITFPAVSLLIIIFVALTFTFNPFHSNPLVSFSHPRVTH